MIKENIWKELAGTKFEKLPFESIKQPVYDRYFQRYSCCGNILANNSRSLILRLKMVLQEADGKTTDKRIESVKGLVSKTVVSVYLF